PTAASSSSPKDRRHTSTTVTRCSVRWSRAWTWSDRLPVRRGTMTTDRTRTSPSTTSTSTVRSMPQNIALFALIAAVLGVPSAVNADDVDGPLLQMGAVVGVNRSILTAPDDREGESQFMSGAALNGFGFGFGGTLRAAIMPFLSVHADVLFSWDRATGFEERGELRRELSISTFRMRIPVLLMAGYANNTWRIEGGVGPEIAIPFVSSGELDETNVPANESFDLAVTGALSFGIAFGISGAYRVTEDIWIPTTFRAGFFPTVGSKSSSRFDGYVSPTEPGALIVDYDWTILWTVGVMFDLVE